MKNSQIAKHCLCIMMYFKILVYASRCAMALWASATLCHMVMCLLDFVTWLEWHLVQHGGVGGLTF